MNDVTKDDIDKPIFTAGEDKIGTFRGVDGPTLYLSLADEMDPELHSSLTLAEKTGITHDGVSLAAAPRASVERVTETSIYFWPAYGGESSHESVEYDEIPQEDSNTKADESG